MDSYPDVQEHESCAKRIKLDFSESNIGELCNGEGFSCFSTSSAGPIDISEGISVDCDSGYEASTLESMPTPSHHLTSPPIDPSYISESMSNMSGCFPQTPTIADQLDTSQDSLGVEDDDDNASTVSELSGLSDLSGQDWKPMAGSMIWIQQQMQKGVNPRILLSDLGVDYGQIPDYVDDVTIWKIIINMLAEPPRRNKLRHVNTLDDIARLMKGAQNIIVLTGAGVSVSCGIPDFRSRDGIYSRLAIDFPNLPDPQAMFDISYFSQDPRPFFKFARDIYPGKFLPSPCHRFIKLLEKHKKLLRNYTQNIDTLEKEASIERVIECHGSFATATCTKCGYKVKAQKIRDTVLSQKIPLCEKCHPGNEISVSTDDLKPPGEGMDFRELVESGIMKPDIVFFGEGLPDTFHEAMTADKSECDLLLVIGSSLKVRPVALIPSSLPSHVPQILINREPLPHCRFDVELLGDCDVIINHLCQLLGTKWEEGTYSSQTLRRAPILLPLKDPLPPDKPERVLTGETTNEPSCTEVEPSLAPPRNQCVCNSTKSSSLNLAKDSVGFINCTCQENYKSIIVGNEFDIKVGKERHMSIDSARDSGIGENSNFTDKYDESDENCDEQRNSLCLEISNDPSSASETCKQCTTDTLKERCARENTSNICRESISERCTRESTSSTSKEESISETCTKESISETLTRESISETLTKESTSDMRGFWQPKVKKSLADRLPENAFHLIPPSRYIFPGAEVFYDPDEKLHYENDSSSSEESESESEYGSQNESF